MRKTLMTRHVLLALLASLVACDRESRRLLTAPATAIVTQPAAPHEMTWSEPVNLGPLVNSPFLEESPTLSNDGLTLYFMSNRPGGAGGNDLWASKRECEQCSWGEPVNLAAVNGPRNENGPSLSRDGHLLFFQSNRIGSQLLDIYLATRGNPKDDQGWGPAVRLGPGVNTALRDINPRYLPIGVGDASTLFFARGVTTHDADIFAVSIARDGTVFGLAQPVSELNDPDPVVDETSPSVRADGREIVFRSTRVGSLGAGDLWVSTRRSADSPWRAPISIGAQVNTISDEVTPSLSFDARTLVFASDRPGGVGGYDLWMSTRLRAGDDDEARPRTVAGPALPVSTPTERKGAH